MLHVWLVLGSVIPVPTLLQLGWGDFCVMGSLQAEMEAWSISAFAQATREPAAVRGWQDGL